MLIVSCSPDLRLLHFIQENSHQKQLLKNHRENPKTLPREHLIGCQEFKMFLLKDPFKVFFFIN